MLKHLYDSFKISILCGSLLMFETSVVLAAGTNITDSDGTITNTQSHTFEKISDTDMLAGLAMLAGGFVTARMIKNYHPITPDVMIAGAAGVAFIAGEIISNVKFKGTIDEMTVEVEKKTDGKVNEEQIQRLQDLKKSYEEAKGATETKKTLQLASAAAFTAAAAYAGYLAYTEAQAAAACKGSIASAKLTLSTCPEALTPSPTSVESRILCDSCTTTLAALSGTLVSIETQRKLPAKSSLAYPKAVASEASATLSSCLQFAGPTPQLVDKSITATCDAVYLTMLKRNQVYAVAPTVGQNNILNSLIHPAVVSYDQMQSREIDYFYLESLVNLFVSKADAGMLPLLGLGAGMAAALLLSTSAVATETDLFMLSPLNRAMVFAGFAAVAFLSSKASANVIEKLDANIKKLEDILNDLAKLAKGVKAQNITQQMVAAKPLNKAPPYVNPYSKNGTLKTECLQSNSTENCKLAADTLQAMPGFANLPDSFKDIATQAVKLGDNLSGKSGVTGATLAGANDLAGKQNALSKLLKQRQNAYEKLTNSKGSLAKGQNEIMDRLKGALRKSLQKQGVTASGLMSSLGGSPVNSSAARAIEDTDTGKGAPAVANVIDTAGNGGKGEKDQSLNLNFKEPTGDNLGAVDMSGGTQAAAPEYQIDSNEINGQNGPSLFELISGRYIKSGYPKLLEEEPVKK